MTDIISAPDIFVPGAAARRPTGRHSVDRRSIAYHPADSRARTDRRQHRFQLISDIFLTGISAASKDLFKITREINPGLHLAFADLSIPLRSKLLSDLSLKV